MPFVKGQKRPENAGRKRGTPNKATADHQAFCRRFLTSKPYRDALEARVKAGRAMEIEKLLYQYAYGRPPEKIELTGKDGQPLQAPQTVLIYLPDNRRNRTKEEENETRQMEQGS